MGRLEDKIAFVTGAGSGIDRATSLGFASEGAKVVLVAKNEEATAAVKAAIVAGGGSALVAPTDVTKEASVGSTVDKATSTYGT